MLPRRLTLGCGAAFIEEFVFQAVQFWLMLVCPRQCAGESSAPVELVGVAAGPLPFARCLSHVLMQHPPLRVLLDPTSEPGPTLEQRFVNELHRSIAGDEQPTVD